MVKIAFLTDPPCDRQTDSWTDRRTHRRTDVIAVAYTHYSIYSVARKNKAMYEQCQFDPQYAYYLISLHYTVN